MILLKNNSVLAKLHAEMTLGKPKPGASAKKPDDLGPELKAAMDTVIKREQNRKKTDEEIKVRLGISGKVVRCKVKPPEPEVQKDTKKGWLYKEMNRRG